MTAPARHGSAILVLLAVVSAACAAPGATGSPLTGASDGPSPSERATPASTADSSLVPEPTPTGSRECPAGPPTLAAVVAVASGYRATCFGSAELVLRGWTWDDRGTYDCHLQDGPPSWLACTADHARLTTAAYQPGDPAQQPMDPADGPLRVAFDPDGAAAAALQPNRWVEVRGRYGDPITESCAEIVDSALEAECRGAFVVSAARVIGFPEVIAPQRWVRVTVSALRVRGEPRLSSAPVGALSAEETAFVQGGPYAFDGQWWYIVGSGTSLDSAAENGWPLEGFVAAGEAGAAFLEPLPTDCARVGPTLADVVAASGFERLACLAGQELTFEGELMYAGYAPDGSCPIAGEIPAFSPRWLAFSCAALQVSAEAPAFEFLGLHADPELAQSIPEGASGRVRVTGHVDDARAGRCEDDGRPPVAWGLFSPPMEDAGVVARCREAFVITAFQLLER